MASLKSWFQVFGVMIGIVVFLAIIAVLLASAAQAVNPGEYNAKYPPAGSTVNAAPTKKVNDPALWSLTAFKSQAINPKYEYIARYPDKNKGLPVAIPGEIIQVLDNGGSDYTIRLATKKSTYGDGYTGDVVWVEYKSSGARPLDNDIITAYGIVTGIKTYSTVLGSSQSIPSMDAKYIETIGRS